MSRTLFTGEVASTLTQLLQYQQESVRAQRPAELQLRRLLEKFRVHYQFQPMVGRRRVDFLILGKQLIFVEIDGGYHYQQPGRLKADRVRDRQIYPILGSDSLSLRLTNRQVFDGTAEETLQHLFRYKRRPFRGFVKSHLISPLAAFSFYKLLRRIFSSDPGIRKGCPLVGGRRIMPVAPFPPPRTALGAYMRKGATQPHL
jgi:very-short-patch-repair endonuclease